MEGFRLIFLFMKIKVYKEERPWGGFEKFTEDQISTVKILTIRAGEELSFQKHHEREEFWRVLSGKGSVVVGDKTFPARGRDEMFSEKDSSKVKSENIFSDSGDEFFVPVETNHTIKAIEEMQVLEISLGEFDEEDVVRISDKYNR